MLLDQVHPDQGRRGKVTMALLAGLLVVAAAAVLEQ
jgi:hypothetical protein